MSEYIFKLPDLGEGTVEAEIAEWNVSVGDVIDEEAVLGAMMTDKAAVEVSAPVAGKIVALAGEPGDVIAVGAPLVTFETDAAGTSASDSTPRVEAPPEPAPSAAATTTSAPARQANGGRVQTSPAIRRMARDAGIDLTAVQGSGPRGRIVRADIDAFVSGQTAPQHKPIGATTEDTVEAVKVIGVRRVIAERMAAAKRTIPHFSYVEEVDLTALESLRAEINAGVVERSDRLTPLAFIALALIRTLREFPEVNAVYDSERTTILRHSAVHLGVATQTDDGLKVPVVHHAQQHNLKSMARAIRDASDKARRNRATKADLTGSTITLTSLGKLGGIASTPVINSPEVAIVGINKAVARPVVLDGQVVVRTMMNISSSFDHRFVDGFNAAAMIQSLKRKLEQPAFIFADL